MKVFVSWSGGKDSMLACYRMMQQPDVEVAYLVNMMTEDGEYSRSHGLSAAVLRAQAAAVGIPLIQRAASWKDYEKEFKSVLAELKLKGVEAGIFGDIDLQPHRDWVERICREAGIQAFLPLWNAKRKDLLEELISTGFKSRIVVTDAAVLGEEWLGCEINRDFMRKMEVLPQIDPCGEKGEYHTFVYDGPMFRAPVPFYDEEHLMIEKHWVLKLGAGLRQKI
ncbi:MAG: diphthine--ammonia ligase [Candidatus Omnitrophota bacterium]|jgi:uncharacterized protein (TIGR00290 family)